MGRQTERQTDGRPGSQTYRQTERKAGLVLKILEMESSQQGSIRGNGRTGS